MKKSTSYLITILTNGQVPQLVVTDSLREVFTFIKDSKITNYHVQEIQHVEYPSSKYDKFNNSHDQSNVDEKPCD